MRNEFHQFVREEFGELMAVRGFRRKGGSFERRERGVMIIATFMRYHEPLRPTFNVRMQVALEAFTQELGVILMRDLSHVIGRGSEVDEWYWPVADAERHRLTTELKEALFSHGLLWLEPLLDPRQLAAKLEEEKHFTKEDDAEVIEIMRALGAANIETAYQSSGFLAPKAGKLRPNVVKALSFCYEVSDEWDLAIRAWEEYVGVVRDQLERDPALALQLSERRAFLETQRERA